MSNTSLVVQMGAKLDNFEQGLDRAVDLAESAIGSIQDKFDNLNPTIGADFVAAGILGAVGGMSALLGFASKVNGELADMDKAARQVGLTVERFQGLRFAGNVKGLDNTTFTEGLQKATGLLADAQRNSNTLLQLFNANGLKIQENNGKLISTNQLLTNAATLINRAASEQDKIKIAAMLGFTREWVPVLERGADILNEAAGEAERLGVVIQQSTIDKAKKFDEEWTKASVSLSTQIKAATADAAIFLSELIDNATKYIDALAAANGATPGSGQEKFNAIADAIEIVRKDTMGLAQDYDQVTRALERYKKSASADPGVVSGLEDVQAKAKAAADELTRAAAARAALLSGVAAAEFPGGVPLPAARPKSPAGQATIIPPKDTGAERDAYKSELDRLEKRIALTDADTQSIGQNIGAREQLRTEAGLYAALERAGIKDTEKYADAIYTVSERAGQSALRLAEANDQLLKINSASQQVGSALSTAFGDAILEAKSLNDVVGSLLKTLARAALNSSIMSLFTPPAGGGLSPFASFFGIGRNAAGTDYWRGGPTWVGENGPEIIDAPRGAEIIPNDVARNMGGGGVAVPVNVTIHAPGADAGGVAALTREVSMLKATLPGVIVSTVKSAQRSRTL